MIIKCWGARGSIPVSGIDYIKYGGDTTCIEIRTNSGDIIIVDAGTGIRRLGNALISEGKNKFHFIFTHAHWDHLMGFPFFKPLYMEDTEITAYRCPFPAKHIEKMMTKIMTPPNFPIKYSRLKAKIMYANGCPDCFQVGSVTVHPITLSHPNSGCGYKFVEDGKTFVFLTDNELGFTHPGGLKASHYARFSANADLMFHDAEYTPEDYKTKIEWGHSTYTDTLDMALEAGVKKLGLFHHNQERTDVEIDEIVKECRRIITEKDASMECIAVACDMTFTL